MVRKISNYLSSCLKLNFYNKNVHSEKKYSIYNLITKNYMYWLYKFALCWSIHFTCPIKASC